MESGEKSWGLEGVSLTYPDTGIQVCRDATLGFPVNTVSCLLGPSGCGKTTLVHLLSGGISAQGGRVRLPGEGMISMVFQEPRLIPWKTVAGNLDFALGPWLDEPDRRREIQQGLDLVGLSGRDESYPDQLSGGQRQRVSLVRAFLVPSSVLLMDEPFQGVDIVLRMQLIEAFGRLWQERPRSVLAVTHEPRDAALLSHQTYVLSGPPVSVAGTVPGPGPGYVQDNPGAGQREDEIISLLLSGFNGQAMVN